MSAYQLLLETITFPVSAGHLLGGVHVRHPGAARAGLRGHPHGAARRCTPGVSYYMYKRILHAERAGGERAEPARRGELSDSVANILAVKTYGREDYERGLFDAGEPRAWSRATVERMWASLTRGIVTACITVVIMSVVAVFIVGRQCLVRHHAGHARGHVHLHLYGDEPVQLHQQRFAAVQPRVRRRERHDRQVLDEPRLVADHSRRARLAGARGGNRLSRISASGIPTATRARRCSTISNCISPQASAWASWV